MHAGRWRSPLTFRFHSVAEAFLETAVAAGVPVICKRQKIITVIRC